jgi:heme/copper-type cytochrome/quinol oxidase subunit 2
MPIAVRAVPRAEFDTWVADAQKRFAQADGSAPVIAAAPTSQEQLQIAEARR